MKMEFRRALRFVLSTIGAIILFFTINIPNPFSPDSESNLVLFLGGWYDIVVIILLGLFFSYIFSFIFQIKKQEQIPLNKQKIRLVDLSKILATLLLTTILWVLLNINFLPKNSGMEGMITDPIISLLYLCVALGVSIFIISILFKNKK